MFGLLALLLILNKLSQSNAASQRGATIFWEVAILGAQTLELRRLKADLMYIYKIVFGLLDVEHGMFDIKLKGGTSTRSGTHCHSFCVDETHGRINARRNL